MHKKIDENLTNLEFDFDIKTNEGTMNKYKSKSKISSVINTIIVTIIIAIMTAWFQHTATEAVNKTALSELIEIGKRQEYIVESAISEAEDTLNRVSEYVVEFNVTLDDMSRFMVYQTQVDRYDAFYYITPDGTAISKHGQIIDYSDNESFINALENDIYVTNPHLSEKTNEIVLDVSTPVLKNGETIAILLCEVSIENFFVEYRNETDNKGQSYLIDQEFNLVYSNCETHEGKSEIPEGDLVEMGSENVEKAQEDVINQQSGGFIYDYYGVDKTMVYMPISNTNWALVMDVESSVISGDITDAVDQLTLACIIIYWFLIMLVCYILVHHFRSVKTLKHAAHFDVLTGLPNLVKFQLLVEEALIKNQDMKFTMQKMDIAKFHVINEVYGFESGNLVLKKVAEASVSVEEETFIFARVGVDEFLMFAGNGYLDGSDFEREQYEKSFKNLVPELADHEFRFRYGRYFIQKGEFDVIDIVNKTSLAHSMAKKNPHKKTWDYDDTFRNEVRRGADISNKRKAAIENDEFTIFLQPKFSIADNKLIGAEALVRWIETDGNMIFPNDFIPLFEKDGFITELDKYVLEKTCIMLKKWLENGINYMVISVNLSRVNLNNPNIVSEILEIVDRHEIPHELIEIELTESASEEKEEELENLYTSLNKHGFKTSIDDFGAGYSSLAMLKNLSVDTLKLDRSFFSESKFQRRDDMLINGIIKLAHSLGMYVIAEGIETSGQVEMLLSMNCDAVQGYFFDKPMPNEMFFEKYKNAMNEMTSADASIEIIQSINDARYASSFVPCGILVSKIDEYFTIIEANEGYFDIIEYTRQETAEIFKNHGIKLLHPEDGINALKYFTKRMKEDPTGQLEFVGRVHSKNNGYKIAKLNGKVSHNEKGENRLYFTFTDITTYVTASSELQQEKAFNNLISSITNNEFFDYNMKTKSIHISKKLAEKFGIPEIIDDFLTSETANLMFPECIEFLGNENDLRERNGECYIKHPCGENVLYSYNCKPIYDENEETFRIVGKLKEVK